MLAAGAVALAAAAPSEAEPYWAAGIAVALLQTLPLAFRRWRPLWVLAVVVAATLGAEIAREGSGLFGLAAAVALYWWPRTARGGRRPGRASPPGPSWPGRLYATAAVRAASSPWSRSAWPRCSAWCCPALAWLSGAYVSELQARAARSRREQERGRAGGGRRAARIARELHDVVAHSMSVIAVQAGVGHHVLDTQPEEARRALAAIETTSRPALTEMRRLLGVLREEGQTRAARPRPGLADLPRLLAQVREAGLDVTAR